MEVAEGFTTEELVRDEYLKTRVVFASNGAEVSDALRLRETMADLRSEVEQFQSRGSGWTFKQVNAL